MARALSDNQLRKLEDVINAVIERDLPVTFEYVAAKDAVEKYDLERLPEEVSEMLRIVHIGDYDACPCVGAHVKRTSEIGHFRISSARYQDGVQRIVFRLD